MHETYIGLVERKARQPTLAAAANLAEALGLSLSDLVAEAEKDVDGGFVPEVEIVHAPPRRYAKADSIVESERLTETTWLSGHIVRKAIDAAYRKLDVIDEQMRESGSPSLVDLVGPEHLDGLLAGALAGGVVKSAPTLYVRNSPRQHPDLLPLQHGLPEMVVKTALETDRPVAGPELAGIYLVFRYVLVDRKGEYTRGKASRGDMVAVWEARFGELGESDFIPPRGGHGPTLRRDVARPDGARLLRPRVAPLRKGDGGLRAAPAALARLCGGARDSLSFARSKIVISACCSSTRGIARRYGWPRSLRRTPMIERASSDGGRG